MLADFTENKKAQGICTPRLHHFYSEMVSFYIPCQLCGEHNAVRNSCMQRYCMMDQVCLTNSVWLLTSGGSLLFFQWSHRVSHQQLQSLSQGKTLQVAMTLFDHVFSTGSESIFLENAHKTFQLRIRIYTCHTAYTCTSTSECYTYRGDLHMLKVFLPQLKEAWPGR